MKNIYAALNKDTKTRMASSSGGIFSLLAEYTISLNGVVYGVEYKQSNVEYIRVEKLEDIQRIRGSKYVKTTNFSKILNSIEEDIINKQFFLFVGTPCLVCVVRNLINKYEYTNCLLVDLICHGVMMPHVHQKIIDCIENKYKKSIQNINYRDKNEGWKEQRWKIEFSDGTQLLTDEALEYKKVYYSHYAHMEACFKCRYTSPERMGDITLGDCWGIENIMPEIDDNKGVSVILINTNEGEEAFEQIKEKCIVQKIGWKDVDQPQLSKPVHVNIEERLLFLHVINKSGFKKASDIMFSRKLRYRIKRNFMIKMRKSGEKNAKNE